MENDLQLRGSYQSSPPCTENMIITLARRLLRICTCNMLQHTATHCCERVPGCARLRGRARQLNAILVRRAPSMVDGHRCFVLQCVATCCSVLQCVAVYFSVLQCVAVHGRWSSLFCVAVRCNVLQCVTVCCSVL